MSIIIERFDKIKSNIEKFSIANSRTIVAVSKTFSLDHIMPLINYGHMHYGENKVQEAESKWLQIKKEKKGFKTSYDWKVTEQQSKKGSSNF